MSITTISNQSKKRALGYLRISDKKQINGESKNNQKAAIQRYANQNNIKIIGWFFDEAKSGKNTERDELQNLLKTAMKMKGSIDYVIVYKMNRASRDLESYFSGIRSILSAKGIQVRSATEHFDDTPSGHFMEAMHVLVGQLDNENKRETVIDNMRRLANQGYWQHKPIRGYQSHTIKNSEGKPRPSMTPNYEAEKVTDVLMRFNRGDLIEAELLRYATANGLLGLNGKPMTQEVLHNMIIRPEYAGYVHDKFTDYNLVAGKHPALIAEEVFWQNQEILKRKNKPYLIGLKHDSINVQAPLSKFILCVNCHRHMTRSNPGGDYRYYCARKTCRGTGSVTTRDAHLKFEEVLAQIEPKESTVKLMKEILKRTSIKELGNINKDLASLRTELDNNASSRSKAINKFVNDQISEEEKDSFINDLDIEKLELITQTQELERRQSVSEESIDYALNFMRNIAKQWADAPFDLKQKFQYLIFPDGFEYDIRNDNFIINKISPLYRCVTPEMETDYAKNSTMVTHVDQTWNSILKGLEQIDVAFDELILDEDQ
ncbi:MAG: recombinase family protein [Candidatus Saccharimonadales bacterium]